MVSRTSLPEEDSSPDPFPEAKYSLRWQDITNKTTFFLDRIIRERHKTGLSDWFALCLRGSPLLWDHRAFF
jgi:hypothetical protein